MRWWKVCLGVCALWILQTVLLSPSGEFPLNDDWAHTLTVFNFVQFGRWFYPACMPPYNLVPIGYGIVLAKLFGFSFTVLRYSNLVLSIASVAMLFGILRHRGADVTLSVIAALLLWFNPLFFNVSYSFMGDVPALAFLVAALWCYERGFRSEQTLFVFLGSLLAITGYFTRQFDILLYVAALTTLYKYRRNLRMLAALVAPALLLLAASVMIDRFGVVPDQHRDTFARFGLGFVIRATTELWDYALLLGIFGLPLTVGILIRNTSLLKKKSVWLMLAAASAGFALMRFPGHDIQDDNLISLYGLGTILPVLQGHPGATWGPVILYRTMQFAGAIAMAVDFFLLFRFARERRWRLDYKAVFAVLYLAAILATHGFDRYLVLLLPVWIILLCALASRFDYSKRVAIACILPLTLYCIVGTYNYLSWNRVRWQAGRDLMDHGIPARQIEGGYEWGGWYLYSQSNANTLTPEQSAIAPWYVKHLFPSDEMKYAISFSPVAGYRVIRSAPVPGICSNIDSIFVSLSNQ